MTIESSRPIRITRPGEYNVLAFQGIKAWTCYRQIRDMLEQRFGDAFIVCFARPVENASNGDIDWYSPIRGVAQSLVELDEAKREKVSGHLRAMALEMEATADELVKSGDPLKITRGNILKLALSYPDEASIYVIGEQPIITAWGFGPGTPGVEGARLSRIGAHSTKSIQKNVFPESKAASKGRAGWLWLLPLLALLLLLFLLFTSFGPVPAAGGKEIFHLDGKPLMEDLPHYDLAALKSLVAGIEKDLDAHVAKCKPRQDQATVPIRPVPQAAPNALEIPQDAENLEFLSGRWLCETGLASTRSGEPVKVFFSFDGKGNGQATIIEQNDQCDGTATARLEGKALHIEMQELQCRKQNSSYGKTAITCENSSSNQTLCVGQNFDGTSWGATFLKLRQ